MTARQRLLVVDDDLSFIALYRRILGKDYEVIPAMGEAEALQIASKHPADLVVLDVHIPGSDGFRIYSRLRKLPMFSSVPVIFVTARADEATERHVLRVGGADCVFKPVQADILRLRIRNLLEREALRLQLQAQCRLLTQRLECQREIEDSLRLGASVFEHSHDGIVIADALGQVVDVNGAFERITGLSKCEVIGKDFQSPGMPWVDTLTLKRISEALASKGHWNGDVVVKFDNELPLDWFVTISRVVNPDGELSHHVALFSDVTLEREHQHRLEHAAHHDPLTGLPNRLLLTDRLQLAIAHAYRSERLLAVGYIDLDGFKAVNDTHGHHVGDALLIGLTRHLIAALRDEDTLARLGGDEFVVVAADMESPEAIHAFFQRLLEIAAQPVAVDGLYVSVSASIGITLYPQPGEVNTDSLLRQADQAMYRAKQSGKCRLEFFHSDPAVSPHNRGANASPNLLGHPGAISQSEKIEY